MSVIKEEERILQAIDKLRRRKSRPDLTNILNLCKRFMDISDAISVLNSLLVCNPPKVIKVNYKGNTSYRRPNVSKNKNNEDISSILGSALSELIIDEPDYLDFGVPPDEFEKFLIKKSKLFKKKKLLAIIEEEINKGNLVRLETGNLSLVDGNRLDPEDSSLFKATPLAAESVGDEHAKNNRNMFSPPSKDEDNSSDDSFSNDSDNETFSGKKAKTSKSAMHSDDDSDIDYSVESSKSASKVGTGSKSKAPKTHIKKTRGKGKKYLKFSSSEKDEDKSNPSEIDGFRDGARRKRAAKKVFDPSDSHVPCKKRGRPLGSKNKETVAKAITKDKDKVELALAGVCYICHHGNNQAGQEEKLISCRDCTNKAHPSCTERKNDPTNVSLWQCVHCKTCCVCSETDEYASMIICGNCGDGYHHSCHTPQVANKKSGGWLCFKCMIAVFGDGKLNDQLSSAACSMYDSSVSTPRASPVPVEVKHSPSPPPSLPSPPATSSSGVSSGVEDAVDESVPDASRWSVKEVADYLGQQGYPDLAEVFLKNEIDGPSLLLMKRSDVLSGMEMKLGPALKAYKQVKRLQIRRSEVHLLWA